MKRTKRLLVWHDGNMIYRARSTLRKTRHGGGPWRPVERVDSMILYTKTA